MGRAARERAAQRRARREPWRIAYYRLGEEPARDPQDRSTIDERVAAVWPLTRAAWSIAGLEIPDYDRSHCPGRLIRR